MICIATWNVEWATPNSEVGNRIQEIISNTESDVFVVTEGCKELLPDGYVAEAGIDWGYEYADKRRRKVLLWSRYPLLNIDLAEQTGMPPGRFVSATVQHPEGDFLAIALCIPWKDAHVRTGRKDRTAWEDHVAYLNGLEQLIRIVTSPLVVVGDYNQRIPRVTQPQAVADKLSMCLKDLQVCTALPLDKPLIDHIAVSNHFSALNTGIISDHDEFGRLSDHRGVIVELTLH
jgi:endonuclease/exonuclease/phosphatase family metal-dependent hydrolase